MSLDYPDWTQAHSTATTVSGDYPDWTLAYATVASSSGDTPDWTQLGVNTGAASNYDAALAAYNPYVWWKLNDPAGTNPVADSGSIGYDGTVSQTSGTVTLGSSGIIPGNTAALFTGTDAAIWAPTDADPVLTSTPMTAICWVRFTSLANAYSCVISANTSTGHGWQVYVKSNGKLSVSYLNNSGGGIDLDGTGTATLVTGTSYMLAITYDAVTFYSYVNGVEDNSVAQNVAPGTPPIFAVANDLRGAGHVTDGTIAEACFIQSALSASQLAALYALA